MSDQTPWGDTREETDWIRGSTSTPNELSTTCELPRSGPCSPSSRPEVVSLAGGMPNLKDLPLDALADSARRLIANHGAQAMQYEWDRGHRRSAGASASSRS